MTTDPLAALRSILGECREYTVYQHGSPGSIIDAIQRKAEAALAATPPAIDPERLARALRFPGIDWPKRVRGWSEDDWRWAARQAIAAYEAEKEVLG